METDNIVLCTPPGPRSREQSVPMPTTRSRFQPQNCIKELVFGCAPLSITGNAQSKGKRSCEGINNDICNVENDSLTPCGQKGNVKRKADTEAMQDKPAKAAKQNLEVEEGEFSDSAEDSPCGILDDNAQISANVTEPKNIRDNLTIGSGVTISSENGQNYNLITVNNNGDYTVTSCGNENFHNPTLQADWSLPCLKPISVHPLKSLNVNSNTRISCSDELQDHNLVEARSAHKNPENKENIPTSSSMESHAVCTGNVPQQFDHGGVVTAMQLWNDYAARFQMPEGQPASLMSESGRQSHSNLVSNRVAGPLLQHQMLQLEGGQGEIMIMPHDMQHNGPIIYVQPSRLHAPPAARIVQQSPSPNSEEFDNRPPLQTSTPMSSLNHGSVKNFQHRQVPNTIQLNSSGEETDNSGDRTADTNPTRAPYAAELQEQLERVTQSLPIDKLYDRQDDNDPSREQHNHKERIRRARIRDACHLMRQLVPGMSDKTDKATVFEFGARYVHFLKNVVRDPNQLTLIDKEFLMKYSPY